MRRSPISPAVQLGAIPPSPPRQVIVPPRPPVGALPRLLRAAAHGVLAIMAAGVALQLALIFGDPPPRPQAAVAPPVAETLPGHDPGHDTVLAPLDPAALLQPPAPVDTAVSPPLEPPIQASVAMLLPPRPDAPPAATAPDAPLPAIVDPGRDRSARLRQKIHFQPNVRDDCLPPKLMGVIYAIAEKFGDVRINSTHRDSRRNARVGGARRSLHLDCRAIDFMATGRPRDIIRFLANHADVGGFKRYPRGHYHIDNGPRRTW
ncbi:MAG: D-Ala-D-Ala carboxypeptidase family metallohydrolase [Hyphomicrobiaceae bacterium]